MAGTVIVTLVSTDEDTVVSSASDKKDVIDRDLQESLYICETFTILIHYYGKAN